MNHGVSKVDLRNIRFTPELLRCIPVATARLHSVLPVFEAGDCLGIVIPDPSDRSKVGAIDELAFITGRSLQIQTAAPEQIRAFIELHYGENTQ